MEPFLSDTDFTLYVGDVRQVLATLPDGSVDCVITSPPYWGLRDYGTGSWDGGDPDCDHVAAFHSSLRPERSRATSDTFHGSMTTNHSGSAGTPFRDVCGKCGARRQDQQLGLEPTPDLYVANMVAVFREVRRVLADHGTCWVNLGDSYYTSPAGNTTPSGISKSRGKRAHTTLSTYNTQPKAFPGLKPKDLVGIPWRTVFALQADGWYLRADIIWAKPNPMPESVTDRPTKAHEYVFLLSKRPRYWFDADAVREPIKPGNNGFAAVVERLGGTAFDDDGKPRGAKRQYDEIKGANVRSVWEIATQPYPEAHFATYPEELVRRCLLAGCPEQVCDAIVCGSCGQSHPHLGNRQLTAYADDEAVPVPEAVQAELRHLRELLRGSESVDVQPSMLGEENGGGEEEAGEADGQLQGREDQPPGLHPLVDAGLPVGDDGKGLRLGAPLRDGAASRAATSTVGEGASPKRGQGGQPLGELGDRDALDASWGRRVSVLRDALLRSLICPDCGSSGFKTCGKPRERLTSIEYDNPGSRTSNGRRDGSFRDEGVRVMSGGQRLEKRVTTEGWTDCGHADYRPGVVLDPFLGSGTTAVVARKHGRRTIGIELNPAYAELAAQRTRQLSLLA